MRGFFKKYLKSTLLSLDLILGFVAVTYSYQWYLLRNRDTISSLVLILVSLGYFIFYPYHVIKLVENDKMSAMARMYLHGLFFKKYRKENEEKDDKRQ